MVIGKSHTLKRCPRPWTFQFRTTHESCNSLSNHWRQISGTCETCNMQTHGRRQLATCLPQTHFSACLKASLRGSSVLQMQSAWLKSLQSWEDVSLIHAVFAHSSLTEAGKECWQASGKVMLAGLFACIPRYTFPRGCAILVCGCLALRRLPPTRSSCAHAFKFAIESTSTQFCC